MECSETRNRGDYCVYVCDVMSAMQRGHYVLLVITLTGGYTPVVGFVPITGTCSFCDRVQDGCLTGI